MTIKDIKKKMRRKMGWRKYYWMRFRLLLDIPWQIELWRERRRIDKIIRDHQD